LDVTMRSISELLNISGRRALVAGGAGYLALAVEEALVEQGATVSVVDINSQACDKRVEELSKIRKDCAVAVPCDLGDEAATRKAVRDTVSKLGGLDIIVHCAAHGGTSGTEGWAVPFPDQTVAAWDAALRINLTSAFVLAQEARTSLKASKNGSIILFSSIYGLVGPDWNLYSGTNMANPVGYGASKGGILQLMRYLSTELAPEVRVNSISPGGVWRDQPEEFHERYKAKAPLGRMAREEDLKGAVAYLASDLSSYVTGHNLVVDGGWTAW